MTMSVHANFFGSKIVLTFNVKILVFYSYCYQSKQAAIYVFKLLMANKMFLEIDTMYNV